MKYSNLILTTVMLFPIFLFGQDLPTFIVQGDEIKGINAEGEQKMKTIMEIFAKVMNDKDFQHEVTTYLYQYDVTDDPNRNLSPQQVATKLYEGQEFYKRENDNTANIHWIIVKKRKPLFDRHPSIGFGYPNENKIYTYTWFFDGPDLPSIVGHIAHEWSHKVGFDHLYEPHDGREKTVPYAFGDLVTKYAKKYCVSN